MRSSRLLPLLFCLVLLGAAGSYVLSPPAAGVTPLPNTFQHIVIIDQENRSFNNIFGGPSPLPGATTAATWTDPNGNIFPISPVPLTFTVSSNNSYNLSHDYADWNGECGSVYPSPCPMSGFGQVGNALTNCTGTCACPTATPIVSVGPTPSGQTLCAEGYVPSTSDNPYWEMAEQYAVGDNVFQDNEGPSFPAHCYMLAGGCPISQGSVQYITGNGTNGGGGGGNMGCDAPSGTTVPGNNISTGVAIPSPFPCSSAAPIVSELLAVNLSARHYNYQPNSPLWDNLWTSPDAFFSIGCANQGALKPTCSPWFNQDVVNPPTQFLNDIATCGQLANVTWITPTALASDHGGTTDGSGPAWVESIVNAIGQSCYWQNTAIIVMWDDWGGWYDPVVPQRNNFYEYGFRVPFIVISAYTPPGYVSHVKRPVYGSMLKFIESTFNLPSLGLTDAQADNLSDFFTYRMPVRSFVTLSYSPPFTKANVIARMKHDHGCIDECGPGDY